MGTEEATTLMGDLERLVRVSRRYRRSIAALVAILVGTAIVGVLLLPEKFRADVSLFNMGMLTGQRSPLSSSLVGVSREFGLDVGAQMDPTSLYGPILRSRRFASRILFEEFRSSAGDSISLMEMFDPGGETENERFMAAHRAVVGDFLRVRSDPKSGVTVLSVTSTDPILAAEVANHCVEELNALLVGFSEMASSGQVSFINERLEGVGAELALQEERLKEFRETNVRSQDSPGLRLQEDRLSREVQVLQQVFLTLKRQLELARIEASKDLERIAVLDPAVPPTVRSAPNRTAIVLFALVAAIVLGLMQAIVRDHVRRSGGEADPIGVRRR